MAEYFGEAFTHVESVSQDSISCLRARTVRMSVIPELGLMIRYRMIDAIAGPYGRNYSQGEVGGVLRELGYTSKEVVKL